MFDPDAAIGWWVRELSAVRASGMPVVLQLVNGGGLSIHPDGLRSSSARKKNAFGVPVAVMTEADIESTVDAFAAAALRAREAGFDGVELHAAHGYLLSEFVSRSLNLRTDAWGGEIAGRGRIVALILSRIRERVADYPVWVKIEAPADDVTRDLSIDAAIAFARELAAAGADAVGVSCGYGNVFQTMRMRSRPSDAVFDSLPSPFGATMKFFATVTLKRPSPIRSYDVESEARIRAAAGVPVLVTGGIRAREDVEAALVKGLDAVTMCRPYVIEPDIASRLRERPSRCVDCGYCLFRVMTRELRCFHGRWD
jgi:2,4-dienoyl-CoA reductase-like NADH-dependent reductase (Old Yellow Enzyme family)